MPSSLPNASESTVATLLRCPSPLPLSRLYVNEPISLSSPSTPFLRPRIARKSCPAGKFSSTSYSRAIRQSSLTPGHLWSRPHHAPHISNKGLTFPSIHCLSAPMLHGVKGRVAIVAGNLAVKSAADGSGQSGSRCRIRSGEESPGFVEQGGR